MNGTRWGIEQLTYKLSGAGAGFLPFKVFLAATFLTADLALTEARGAAALKSLYSWEPILLESAGSASQPF
jgi:hypothetical protein